MSTRAVYLVKDKYNTFMVYKHQDGYPSGAAKLLNEARSRSWPGNRFEADEAAASIVAAGKEGAGGVRIGRGNELFDAPGDVAYGYKITSDGKDWNVEARQPDSDNDWSALPVLFKGSLADFAKWAETHD